MDKYTIPLEKAVELTPIPSEPDTFTNAQPLWSFAGGYGVYGGSTVAHCLVAAQKTVPSDYIAHSLHCGFVSPGNPKRPIEYRVERTRDGKSFITRTVHATQKAGVISEAIVNFVRVGTYSNNGNIGKVGRLEHGRKMPKGLTLPGQAEMDGKGVDGPFEAQTSHDLVNTQIRYWVRAKDPIQQRSPQAQLAALAYMSDAYFIGAAVQVHDVAGQAFGTKMAMAASLNHTIYFHHPEAVRADEWMCSERESPWAGNDRALVVQRVWSPEGILVATSDPGGLTCPSALREGETLKSPSPDDRAIGDTLNSSPKKSLQLPEGVVSQAYIGILEDSEKFKNRPQGDASEQKLWAYGPCQVGLLVSRSCRARRRCGLLSARNDRNEYHFWDSWCLFLGWGDWAAL
ncbi:hypothetical protein N7489_011214 [Penicillium chrysogenum]|uniref:uncharacterized protein n=1 Tax=Penicillium chrysogenum TaxID=5076 RepID=UPI0024DF0B28|nr:uncharacterized protein N7489_011214 [Penicillium chrysogenum]KAJ5230506.1 hypothetical protein N7489_011214 [Penicillium chrysogenum]